METTATTTMQTLNPHSVEITQGQNGKVGFSVKSYGQTVAEASDMALGTFLATAEKISSAMSS